MDGSQTNDLKSLTPNYLNLIEVALKSIDKFKVAVRRIIASNPSHPLSRFGDLLGMDINYLFSPATDNQLYRKADFWTEYLRRFQVIPIKGSKKPLMPNPSTALSYKGAFRSYCMHHNPRLYDFISQPEQVQKVLYYYIIILLL